jgi:hypothetical protein
LHPAHTSRKHCPHPHGRRCPLARRHRPSLQRAKIGRVSKLVDVDDGSPMAQHETTADRRTPRLSPAHASGLFFPIIRKLQQDQQASAVGDPSRTKSLPLKHRPFNPQSGISPVDPTVMRGRIDLIDLVENDRMGLERAKAVGKPVGMRSCSLPSLLNLTAISIPKLSDEGEDRPPHRKCTRAAHEPASSERKAVVKSAGRERFPPDRNWTDCPGENRFRSPPRESPPAGTSRKNILGRRKIAVS